MSVETTPCDRATDLASELGELIAELDSHETFLKAREEIEADEELQAEIEAFESKREEFLMAQEAGSASNEDLRELREAQEELHESPKMKSYLRAKSDLELQLQELEFLISEPLGVDFGETAGGCCQD